jgi:hypothetical protein
VDARATCCVGFVVLSASAALSSAFGYRFRLARRVPFGKRPKRNQKVCAPASGSGCARLPSLHHCSRGPLRRAIPGPSQYVGWMAEAIHHSGFVLASGGKAFGVFHPTELHSRAQRKEKPPGNSEPKSPSGGRVEVLRRGGREAGRRARNDGAGTPLRDGPGAASE